MADTSPDRDSRQGSDPDHGPDHGPDQGPRGLRAIPPVIWILLGLCTLPELVLQGADAGFWGDRTWRGLTYQNGAFWRGLLGNWQPNYPFQPVLMFVTYAFLHGGLWHMGLNMVTLVSFGQVQAQRLGQGRFLILYGAAVLGGALVFALFGPRSAPMVGASGGLFGLAGAMVLDLWWDNRTWRGIVVPVAVLIALNVVMYYAGGGVLAWQTHLGGFIAGVWVMGLFLIREGD